MTVFTQLVTLATSVLIGSAVPFVPTGEMVSAAAALAASSLLRVVPIFLVAWLCSALGDLLLLLEVGAFRRPLQGWLGRRKFGTRVEQAEDGLAANALTALLTARLIPGARAPLIVALGLGRFPIRRFVMFDTVACALWAAVYATIGSVGGSLFANPLWGALIAIAVAVLLSVVVGRVSHLATARSGRASDDQRQMITART